MDDFYQSTERDLAQIEKIDSGDHPGYPKFVIWGTILLSSLIVVVVFLQMQSNLTLQIPQFGDGSITTSESLSITELEDEQLRDQDSDEDGLTDYEELRVYGTNAFIADSDSDGLTDISEIENGTNPNCPEGQDCFNGTDSDLADQPQSEFQTGEVFDLVSNPTELKRILIEQGADPRLVNSLDDQSLQALASQSFDALAGGTPEQFALLQGLSAEEIRTLLKVNGATDELLEQLSDEELVELYQQSLALEEASN